MPKKSIKTENETKKQETEKPQTESRMAVIELSGHQFLVKEGDVFDIDNQGLEIGKNLEAKALLAVDGEQVKVGQPYVEGVRVKLEVLENLKGEKIEVIKYKAKSRYRKHIGYRSHLTRVKVISI